MKRGLFSLTVVSVGFLSLSLADPARHPVGYWSEAYCFSAAKERTLGEKVFHDIQNRMRIVRIPSVQSYIDRLGRNLVSVADRSQFPITFFVLKESEPNAFAIPGGRIFLTSGLLTLVESEDELAGVMSHEIGHVVRRHIAQRIDASKRLNLGTLAGVLAGILVGGSGGGAMMAGTLAMTQSANLRNSRENEFEADRLGLAYMTRAGYDGHAMIRFLKKIYRGTGYNSAFPTYLSTHPGVPARIAFLESMMGSRGETDGQEKFTD
ncbi:MAG: M48 family metalloprotease, partial [Deltaproteobacteria bacterium]|nr:M48 family metalloprotease [Deltaproteobacteria bacterium]